ncbi:CBS domain-containing protein [Streptomyces sp. NPDC018352]|uniref:CBS domain-containing protein n=1 Tax=Streptomyces sp. NPDC018352 TaxID=3157194 RepID=UPI00340A406F
MEERQPGVVHDEQEVLARTVAAVMRTAAVTIDIDETVLVAWELLERSGSRYLPVVHSDGRCVGLLDRADMAVVCAAPAVSLSGLRVGDLHPAHRSAADRGRSGHHARSGVPGREVVSCSAFNLESGLDREWFWKGPAGPS